MGVTREQIVKEVAALVKEGFNLFSAELLAAKGATGSTKGEQAKEAHTGAEEAKEKEKKSAAQALLPIAIAYQSWYTRALPLVTLVLPDRYAEFVERYKLEKRKGKEIDFLTYTISDYLVGLRVTRGFQKESVVDALGAFTSKFQHQIFILRSCTDRITSAVSEIRETLKAELFDDELDAAKELLKQGHVRAAGALAGVTLERHLKSVAAKHGLKISKASPTIGDLNDGLKQGSVLNTADWRFIQRLGDLRNVAVHDKGREPTEDEIRELVSGAEKIVTITTLSMDTRI